MFLESPRPIPVLFLLVFLALKRRGERLTMCRRTLGQSYVAQIHLLAVGEHVDAEIHLAYRWVSVVLSLLIGHAYLRLLLSLMIL